MSKKKKNREKIRYIDDGSTVYDMSGVGGGKKRSSKRTPEGKTAFQTYKESVKMMLIPMLVTLAAITVIFGILYLIFTIAELKL